MPSKPPPSSVHYPWWVPLAVIGGGTPFRALTATLRVSAVVGAEHLERVCRSGQPAIFAFWHNREIVCAEALRRTVKPRGVRLALMASLSTDGELAARYAAKLGYQVVRGSASRSATAALHRLYRAITRDGCSILMTPDGPRGPKYVCKPGAVALSRLSGAPIVPLSCAVSRAWRIASWDRLFLPKPFARAVLAIGEPVLVSRELDQVGQSAAMAELGEALGALSDEAEHVLARISTTGGVSGV